ncbi:MAG: hypothetical protein IPN84_09545 [Sphingomonadales bacterium]|nr:hypothetical protein [Sphingomonadales bacterium]
MHPFIRPLTAAVDLWEAKPTGKSTGDRQEIHRKLPLITSRRGKGHQCSPVDARTAKKWASLLTRGLETRAVRADSGKPCPAMGVVERDYGRFTKIHQHRPLAENSTTTAKAWRTPTHGVERLRKLNGVDAGRPRQRACKLDTAD